MKTNKYIVFTNITLILLSLFGCKEEFLDRTPGDQLTAPAFFQSDDDVYMSTAALYNVVWTGYNNKCGYALGDARGGNLKSNDRNNYYKFTVQGSYDEVKDAWTSCYNVIAQSNMVIYNIKLYAGPNVSEKAKKQAIAEAKTMRALAYATLVMLWGPVPIIYNNIAQLNDSAVVPNTEASIWEYVLRDLTFAAYNLPDPNKEQVALGRLTKYSGEGLLARYYLYHSGFGRTNQSRNQAELDSCIKYAADVCHNSPNSLLNNYYDLFLWAKDNNSESMFALQWVTTDDWTGVKNQLQAFLAYETKITGAGDGWGKSLGPSADMVSYYLANPADSVRRKATFMFNGDHYKEILSDKGGYDFTGAAAIKKYVVGTSADNPQPVYNMGTGNNTYMLRLAEVYLIYAEALLGDNLSTANGEALEYFNRVRTRAGVPVDSSLTFNEIFREKRVELCMEGNTWYELVRWYYFQPDSVLKYIGNQDKGESYTLTKDASEISGYKFEPQHIYYVPNASNFYLPLPEIEAAQANNLRKTPVPFDFNLYDK